MDLELVGAPRWRDRGRRAPRCPTSRDLRIGWRRPSQPLKSPTRLTPARRRRPHRERDAGARAARAQRLAHVGPEFLVEPLVLAFARQVQIQLAQRRQIGIGVVPDLAAPGVEREFQVIAEHLLGVGEQALEHPRGVDERELLARLFVGDHGHRLRVRAEHADHQSFFGDVRAEDRMRIGMRELDQPIPILGHQRKARLGIRGSTKRR